MANQVPSLSGGLFLAAINLVMSCFFAAAWPVLPGPQVILGGMLFLCLVLCGFANGVAKANPA